MGEMLAAIDAGNTYHIAMKMRRGEKLTEEEGRLAGEILSYGELPSMSAGDEDFEKMLKAQ